jgi:hypothetical protein
VTLSRAETINKRCAWAKLNATGAILTDFDFRAPARLERWTMDARHTPINQKR